MDFKKITIITFTLTVINTWIFGAQETWKASDGRTMEAEFVRTEVRNAQTFATFRKTDNRTYQFPVAKLDENSQLRIAKYETEALKNSPIEPLEIAREKTDFEKKITKNLVKLTGRRLKKIASSEIEEKDYYAFYFSAQWCPPCRKFTPKLVDFYKKQSKRYDNFEIIFVSSDRSEEDMEEYIEEYKMPWPALNFGSKKKSSEITKYSSKGIPCLVLVDSNGEILADSYVDGKYVGPIKVMNILKKKLKDDS